MRQIIEPSSVLKNILGVPEFNFEKKYRPLKFLIKTSVEDGVLIRNQLTYEMVLLEESEYAQVFENMDMYCDVARELVKKRFLVEYTYDEYKVKLQIRNLLPLLIRDTTRRMYSILTTLDCNARCFYCFENDSPKYSMTDETADNVVNYIAQTYNNQPIHLSWFGGEPLYNMEAIKRIITGLSEKGIDYVSTITTNGYLFDEEVVKQAKLDWKLISVQITLDGTEEIYNKVKNYIYKTEESAFYRVIRNIHLLLNAEISVNIRLNIERHNISDIENLINQLHNEFNGNKYLHIYPALLFDDCRVNMKKRDEILHNELLDENIRIKNKLFDLGYYRDTLDKAPRSNSCMADNDYSIMILPNGNLSRCERITDENRFGDVVNPVKNKELMTEWKQIVDFEDCKTCPAGIECMHLRNCPSWGNHGCGKSTQKTVISSTQFAMKNEYRRFKEKQ